MKHTTNALLTAAIIIPLILLLWPFAMWNDAASLILRVIPACAAQVLFFRIGKWKAFKVIPAVLTAVLAAWGTYLFLTSDHWINATFCDLIADYLSPFISCAAALAVCLLTSRKK